MDRSFTEALEQNIARITGSDVFCSLYSDGMADFRKDPWPTIQLAIAILLDKPIIVACLAGRTPPPKLMKIADAVVSADDIVTLTKLIYAETERLSRLTEGDSNGNEGPDNR